MTVVHPGGVATQIANNARAPAGVPREELARRRARANRLLRMPPDKAGEIIVRGVEQRKPRVLVGGDAVALSTLARIAPVSYGKLLAGRIRD